MEREGKDREQDFLLQWGYRKRLRCVKHQAQVLLQWGYRKRLRCVKRQAQVLLQWGYRKRLRCVKRQAQVLLQWGYRKRLRCVKHQAQVNDAVDKRKESDLVRRQSARHDRNLRNLEASGGGMKGNGGVRTSPRERGGRGGGEEAKGTAAIEAHDKKGGSGGPSSSSGSEAAMWPTIVIGLTNKEKEEDFLAIKGSKPPHRPKKRTKFIQKTINLVSPGAWLCDLTLERYEVREKKISKKRPRGLKAMGEIESDSE